LFWEYVRRGWRRCLGVQGMFRVSETAQVALRSGRVQAPAASPSSPSTTTTSSGGGGGGSGTFCIRPRSVPSPDTADDAAAARGIRGDRWGRGRGRWWCPSGGGSDACDMFSRGDQIAPFDDAGWVAVVGSDVFLEGCGAHGVNGGGGATGGGGTGAMQASTRCLGP
jgi:hypothetical protein